MYFDWYENRCCCFFKVCYVWRGEEVVNFVEMYWECVENVVGILGGDCLFKKMCRGV